MKPPMDVRERFLRSVKKTKTCWLWKQSLRKNGYGRFHFNENGGYDVMAHRASYQLFVGPTPDHLYVCHSCDVKRCVNPLHLFLGTPTENMEDASKKGRLWIPSKKNKACRHGHKYTEKSTAWFYSVKNGKKHRSRRCRACSKNMAQRYRNEGRYKYINGKYTYFKAGQTQEQT